MFRSYYFQLAFIGCCLLFVAVACTPPSMTYQAYDLREHMQAVEAAPKTYSNSVNYDNEAYLPDTLHPDYTPVRTIMVNFHIMNTQDTFYKIYEGDEGIRYMRNLVASANEHLAENIKATLMPIGTDVAVYPINFKLKLAKKPGTNEPGVYHHYDDELYDFIRKGPKRNLGNRQVIQKYGVNTDAEFNLFVMPPNIDSLKSKTFKPNEMTGVYIGLGAKLGGFYPVKKKHWEHNSIVIHEIAHGLGLNHAWRNDGCDDTREHANNCWNREQNARCDTMTSNNFMDYSAVRRSFTPCQIGRIHARFGNLNSRSRKWLRRDWCKPARDDREILVEENISWDGNRDLNTHIRIKDGARLFINSRLHMARGRKIIIEPGGVLELGPKARLHNDCEENWAGIETGKMGKKEAQVIIDPTAQIENTGV